MEKKHHHPPTSPRCFSLLKKVVDLIYYLISSHVYIRVSPFNIFQSNYLCWSAPPLHPIPCAPAPLSRWCSCALLSSKVLMTGTWPKRAAPVKRRAGIQNGIWTCGTNNHRKRDRKRIITDPKVIHRFCWYWMILSLFFCWISKKHWKNRHCCLGRKDFPHFWDSGLCNKGSFFLCGRQVTSALCCTKTLTLDSLVSSGVETKEGVGLKRVEKRVFQNT